MPPSAIAGPDSRTSTRASSPAGSASTTSITVASNVEIVVPWSTERTVQRIPERTSLRGIVGSPAARAPAAEAARSRTASTKDRRGKGPGTLCESSGAMGASPPPLAWRGDALELLDQTRLPAEEVVLACRTGEEVATAIRRLAVRGAPLIGVAAAYGIALDVARDPGAAAVRAAADLLRTARPTAANLAWAVDRVAGAALARDEGERAAAARAEAE